MQLTNIGKNKTMITHKVMHESKEFSTDYDVYFSYSQPMVVVDWANSCLLYTSPSPRDGLLSRMPSSA